MITQGRDDRRWSILIGISLLNFFMISLGLIPSSILDIITTNLSLSPSEAGFMFSSPLLVVALLSIPSGVLGDKFGPNRIITLGALLLVLGSSLRGVAQNYIMLIAFTMVYGLGWAMLYPNYPKIVSQWFLPEKAGIVTGVYFMSQAMGIVIVLPLTRLVVYPAFGSFQATFFFFGLLSSASVFYWVLLPKGSIRAPNLSQSIMAHSNHQSKAWLQRNIILAAISFFFENLIAFSFSGWLPTFIAKSGADMSYGTLVASTFQFAGGAGLFLLPYLSDRLRRRKPFLYVPYIIATFLLLTIPLLTMEHLLIAFAILGFLMYGLSGILFIQPIETLDSGLIGKATGLIVSIGYSGGFLGPFLAGYIIERTNGVALVFLVLSACAMGGTMVCLLMKETFRRRRKEAEHNL